MGRVHRSYRPITFLFQKRDDMDSQSDVELLAEVAGMGPEERGIDLFFAVAPADVL